jgi:hypothetical protein
VTHKAEIKLDGKTGLVDEEEFRKMLSFNLKRDML